MSGWAVERVRAAAAAQGLDPQANAKGWRCRCPAHEDDYLSLTIVEGKGAALVACHAPQPCTFDAIVAALGLTPSDTFDTAEAPRPKHVHGHVTGRAEWGIRDVTGNVVARHIRLDRSCGHKTFVWEQPDGTSGLNGKACEDLPLYGIDQLDRSPGSRVVVVEGEKAADALRARGLPAVGTVTGAASAPGPATLEALAGMAVTVWADNDEVGRVHMAKVCARLAGIAAEVRVIRWKEAPPKADGADFQGTNAELEALLAAAVPFEDAPAAVTEETEPTGGRGSVASVTGWEPLRTLPADLEPAPFPVDALPFWLVDWTKAQAEALQCPLDLPAVLALTSVGACVAAKWCVKVTEGHFEPLAVYGVVALPSGEKKSPAFRAALEPIRAWEAEERARVAPELARARAHRQTLQRRLEKAQKEAAGGRGTDTAVAEAADALRRHPVPVLPQLVTEDVTPDRLGMLLREQHGRIGVFSDEGALFHILAGRYADAANVELFNKGHAATPYVCDRVGREGVRVERPTVTVGLAVQPEVLALLADTKQFRATGTLARFFYALPRSRLGARDPNPPTVPSDVREMYGRALRSLLSCDAAVDAEGEYVPQALPLGPEAHARLIQYRRELEPRLGPEGDLASMADWANKAPGAAVRLAAILHLADRALLEAEAQAPIDAGTMDRACMLMEYFLAHARLAFDLMELRPEVKRLRAAARWLARVPRERVTVRDVQHDLHFDVADHARQVLEELEDRAYVRRLASTGPRGPGRPSEVYEVNPALYTGTHEKRGTEATRPSASGAGE